VNSTTCAITGRAPRHLSVFHHPLVYGRRLLAGDRIVPVHLAAGRRRGSKDGWKVAFLTADDPMADHRRADDPTADEHPVADRVEAGRQRDDGRRTAYRGEGRRQACRVDAPVRDGRVSMADRRVRDCHREPTAASHRGHGPAADR
jgi:hypothetical protein